MLHEPPADPGVKPGDAPTTPCAVWVLGWACAARVKGVDGSRVCPEHRGRLPAPPYGDQGQHARWEDLVWAAEAVARGAPHGAAPARVLQPPPDPRSDVGSFVSPRGRRGR